MKKGTLLKTGILALVLLMAAGVLGIMGLMSGASSTSAVGPVTVGIDFNTGDNTSTTVGAIQTCLEVPSGGSYTLDVYVQNIAGPPSAGMIGGQYTLNSISGNTGTARSVTGGFIDTNPTLSSTGTATIDSGASTPLGSTGSDTPVSSNDPAIGGTGATGDGFWLRMTYTAPTVGSPTSVPLSLADITLNDPSANEIPVVVTNSALLVIAPGGATTCANLTQPDVKVTKTAVTSPVLEPAAASFTIKTETLAPVDSTNTVMTDILPTVDDTTNGWSINPADGFCTITAPASQPQTLTCTYPTQSVGASDTVTVQTATMTSDCAAPLNNTATVTTTGENSSKLANNTSLASVVVTCPGPDVTVSKTADTPTVTVGDTASFTVETVNLGPGTATNVVTTDTLPTVDAGGWSIDPSSDALSLLDCTITGGYTLTCNYGTMADGLSTTVVVTAPIMLSDCGATLDNTANVTSSNEDPAKLANNSSMASIVVQCPQLIVQKICDPALDTGLFNLQIDGITVGTGFDTPCGGGVGPVYVTPGGHTVGETAGSGTSLTNYTTVIGGDCDGAGSITLAQTDVKTCTITNTRQPTLTVNKVCDPAADTGLFDLQIDSVTQTTDSPCENSTGPVQVSPGGHTVSELAGTGTSLSDYESAVSGDCAPDGTITLAAGQNATCTITNTLKPTLTVNKVCDPATDTGLFDLQIDGTTYATDAPCDGTGTTGAVQTSTGAHTVGEAAGTGTSLSDYSMAISGDCAADGTITLAGGQNATCTITNTRLPTLTVNKVCDPITDTGTFTLIGPVTGTISCGDSTGPVVVATGAYTESEVADPAYTTAYDAGCTGTLSPADNATCTITNTRQPTLTVNKVCDPITDTGTFTLTGPVTGTISCGDSTGPVVVATGPYTEGEVADPAYTTAYSAGCSGTLNPGDNATCTITNTLITGTITVHKFVLSGGEPASSFCFTLSPDPGNGQVCASGSGDSGDAFFSNVPAGTYSATETSSPLTYHELSNDCAGLTIVSDGDFSDCHFVDDINHGVIVVHKTVDSGGEPASSFCFTLSPDPGNGQVCAEGSGDAVFSNVPSGTYNATETSSPATYHEVSNDCTGLPVLSESDFSDCYVHDAENSATITVDKTWIGTDGGSVSVTLDCGGNGTIDPPNPAGTPALFTVNGYTPPLNCTASEATPAGYTSDSPCTVPTITTGTGFDSCTITNTQQPDVTVAKTNNGTAIVAAGGTGKFRITTTNLGPSTATNLTTTDTLPTGMSWSIDVANTDATSNADCSITGNVLTCLYGSQASGFSSFVTVQATTSTLNCGLVTNNASVSADNERPGANANNTATASFTVTCGTGRHDVAVDTSGDDGLKFPNKVHPGQKFNVQMEVENLGTVTETQIGYKVVASCVGTCTGTITLSAVCTGTVGPLKPKHELSIKNCTATPSSNAGIGNVWKLTLMVIHCGADGGPPCTTNDGGVDANPSNNIRSRNFTIVH